MGDTESDSLVNKRETIREYSTRSRGKLILLIVIVAVVVAAVILLAALGATGHFSSNSSSKGMTRTYYIAADPVTWEYASDLEEGNPITGEPYTDEELVFLENGDTTIGPEYLKCRYQEYTDSTFSILKEIPAEWAHVGILGPVIRGIVGDTLIIHFQNNCPFNYSMHPHGVVYKKGSEGAPYNDASPSNYGSGQVPPGGQWTYTWEVAEESGPGPNDPSSIVWLYHSHTNEIADTNAGLVGVIIVTAKGKENDMEEDLKPKDVDRELIVMFTVFDENESEFLEDNVEEYCGTPQNVSFDDPDFEESNKKHTINGKLYGNLEGLEMDMGELVRWYVVGLGNEFDIHTPHWHAQTLLWQKHRTDLLEIIPGTMLTADMKAYNPGIWLFHCHVNDHIAAGMQALYTVNE